MRELRARRRRARRRRNSLIALLLLVFLISSGVAAARMAGRRKAPGGAGAEVRGRPGAEPGRSADQAPASAPGAGGEKGGARRAGEAEDGSWVKFRVPGPVEKRSANSGPRIAIVVDDVGGTSGPLEKWLAIDAPISFSVMPHVSLADVLAWRLYQSGYAVMMHIPTENQLPNSFSGKGQLSVGMSEKTIFSTLDGDLATVPFAKGINNHQGGRGCDDLALMTGMCRWAESRGLYVVDSSSSFHDQVTEATRALGMPTRKNQVFIDHENDPERIRGAMRRLAEIAGKDGTAIGICHWNRPNTATVVGEMVRALKRQGVGFAFARDISN